MADHASKLPSRLLAVLGALALLLTSCNPPSGQQQTRPSSDFAGASTEQAGTATYGGQFTYAGEALPKGYPHALTKLVNQGYLVAYDEVRKNPAWAAYFIPKERKFGP